MKALTILCVFLAGPALADGPDITVDGTHRARFQMDGKRDISDGELNERVENLLRLGVTFGVADRVTVVGRIQDVRLWGSETSTLGDFSADGLDLHEGYARIDALTGDFKLAFEVGRAVWSYDDQRIIGRVGWTFQDRRFDGGRVKMGGDAWSLDLMYAKTAESDAGRGHDADVFGLHGEYRLKNHVIALLALGDLNDTDGLDQKRYTAGVFLRGKPDIWRYRLEGYVQMGEAGGEDIFAFLASADVGVAMGGSLPWSFSAGGDFLSGDDKPGEGDIKTFDTLFATNHKFYGFMDFFLNVPKHTGGGGLIDIYGKASVKPVKQLKILAHFHHLRLADDAAGGGEAGLGNEIDLVAIWKPFGHFKLIAGGGIMLPDKALTNLRGGGEDMESWLFVQTAASF